MRRDSGYSDDDIVMTSGDDTEKLMTSDLTSSDDEARTLKRPGGCSLHWGWVVVDWGVRRLVVMPRMRCFNSVSLGSFVVHGSSVVHWSGMMDGC